MNCNIRVSARKLFRRAQRPYNHHWTASSAVDAVTRNELEGASTAESGDAAETPYHPCKDQPSTVRGLRAYRSFSEIFVGHFPSLRDPKVRRPQAPSNHSIKLRLAISRMTGRERRPRVFQGDLPVPEQGSVCVSILKKRISQGLGWNFSLYFPWHRKERHQRIRGRH